MALSMHQVQKQTQRLIMTPQMQQSIQLLQMNSMDLEQLISREMMDNPFLELADDEEGLQSAHADGGEDSASAPEEPIGPPDSGLSDQQAAEAATTESFDAEPDAPAHLHGEQGPPLSSNDPVAADPSDGANPAEESDEFRSLAENGSEFSEEYVDSDPSAYAGNEDEEERDFTTYTAIRESLYDSLRRQLTLSVLSGPELEIGEFLIGNVNDDGYLDSSPENLLLILKFPVEFVRPDDAGKAEFVESRLRRALAHLHGGVSPDAFATMKRRELLVRIFANILGEQYESVAAMPRERVLRRLIANRMKREPGAFDKMPLEDLLLQVVAYRLRTRPDTVYGVLEVLHEFEPTGICARTLAECLRLQCEERGIRDRLLYRILDESLDMLLQKKFRELARQYETTEERVGEVFTTLSKMEPRPGRSQTRDRAQTISPDVFVKKVDGRYLYYLNEGDAGRLLIASKYRSLLDAAKTEKAAPPQIPGVTTTADSRAIERASHRPAIDPEFVHQKYRSAIWLIKNIEKRKGTILRVTEAIMEYQRAFLEKGIEHLRPLTLRDIAEVVGMHESTIARVTTNKYVETPRGTFELKYFFNSGLETDEGDMAASRAIKELISQLIGAENTARPLSDQKIADKLREKGIMIARRTVAKYREQLKILPARLRKEVKRSAKAGT